MDGPRDYNIILSKVSQKKTNTIDITYVESKIRYRWTYSESRNRLMGIENNFMVTKGKRVGEGVNQVFGISKYQLLYKTYKQ